MIKNLFLFSICFIFSLSVFSQVVINEYSAANLRKYQDDFKKTEDWIELYNTSPDTVDIGGYYLSDDKTQLKQWQLPPSVKIPGNGFLIVWASGRDTASIKGLHTNFKLTQTKKNTETITLSNGSGVLLDEIKINKTKHEQSRARTTDGGSVWAICTKPTFKSTNSKGVYFKSFADRPSFDQKAGFYSNSVTVAIQNNAPNTVVRYTLDGTEPTTTSQEYAQPIEITKNSILKAVAFSLDTNVLSSFVEFATYFINEKHTLPVVSISGDSLDALANGNQDLKPFGSIEYFNKAGERKASSYGEYNSHGQDSWVNDQRSLDYVARDECGYDKGLKEKIFELSDRTEFQRIILRAAGDDNYPATDMPEHNGDAHVRDAYIHNLCKKGGLNLDYRISEKSIIYLNGEYWGVYDLREIPDDSDYTEFYYGQGKYDIQYILTWGETWVEYGDSLTARKDWKALSDYILKNDMAIQAKFDTVAAQLDVKSLVDYVIINSVTVCTDWLNYNTGWWRGHNPAGTHQKWGYILWDNDATFGYYINYTGVKDTTPKALPCNVEKLTSFASDPIGHIRLLNRLLKNPSFKQYYVSRYIDLLNTTFSCSNMLGYLDTIVATIDPEMQRHIDRWGGTYQEWRTNVQRLRYFIERRCDSIQNGMRSCYALKGPFSITFDVNPAGVGTLDINSLTVKQFPYTGKYYGGIDIKLNPTVNAGQNYVFDRFVAQSDSTVIFDSAFVRKIRVGEIDTVIALFKIKTAISDLPLGISEMTVSAFPTTIQDELTILYDLPTDTKLSIRLYNQVGQPITTFLQSEKLTAGHYVSTVSIPQNSLTQGIYYLKVEGNGVVKTIKLVRM